MIHESHFEIIAYNESFFPKILSCLTEAETYEQHDYVLQELILWLGRTQKFFL